MEERYWQAQERETQLQYQIEEVAVCIREELTQQLRREQAPVDPDYNQTAMENKQQRIFREVSTGLATVGRRMQTERKKDARSREASLMKAILAQVRKSYGAPVEDDDDDDTMLPDDHDQ